MIRLTETKKRHFDSFGFLFLPGLLRHDIVWIDEEFEKALTESTHIHDGKKRTSFSESIVTRERICELIEHPAINGVLSSLLGDEFIYLGTGADIYVGDSQWHPDMQNAIVPHLKIALYLDPLTIETGAIRVVPGSHVQGFIGNINTEELWGLSARDVPCWSPDNTPGDAVVFNLHTLHNAIGGGNRRRMLNIVACAHGQSPEELAYLDKRIMHCDGSFYGNSVVDTASADRMRHLALILERERALGKRP